MTCRNSTDGLIQQRAVRWHRLHLLTEQSIRPELLESSCEPSLIVASCVMSTTHRNSLAPQRGELLWSFFITTTSLTNCFQESASFRSRAGTSSTSMPTAANCRATAFPDTSLPPSVTIAARSPQRPSLSPNPVSDTVAQCLQSSLEGQPSRLGTSQPTAVEPS